MVPFVDSSDNSSTKRTTATSNTSTPPRCISTRFTITLPSLLIALTSPSPANSTSPPKALNHDPSKCLLYLAPSTIPNAGIGIFAGTDFHAGQSLNRNSYGDLAYATVDLNWNNADPVDGTSASKSKRDYHWPLTNYDWSSKSLDIIQEEGDETSMTVIGFGAVPNCHFSLLNVAESGVSYDLGGLTRYDSPGSGAITPFVNRTSTARVDIRAGSELFVSYGSAWFMNRKDYERVPVKDSYLKATEFLERYGRFLIGGNATSNAVVEKDWKEKLLRVENMILKEEAQRVDLYELIKTFPYVSRAREALPPYGGVIRAIHKGIGAVEVENSMRSMDYLEQYGKCVDNIVPGNSTIPHVGRGAFATRFIPKGGLVAPAPLVHFADKSTLDMYNTTVNKKNRIVKNSKELLTTQLIRNYMFGHPNSSVVLLPYSSNVAFINHHSSEFNARLQWASNFTAHNEDWLYKDVRFLEQQWRAGLMLEFIATRDIMEGEEILIDYGDRWQTAWDEHIQNWKPVDPSNDYNNYTYLTKFSSENAGNTKYRRAELFKLDGAPLRTKEEQNTNPYPRNVVIKCRVDLDIGIGNYTHTPKTTPFYRREFVEEDLIKGNKKSHICNILKRKGKPRISFHDEDIDLIGPFLYTVEISNFKKKQGKHTIIENHEITDVPIDAIDFVNEKYTSDMFLKNAFRHEMGLPDGLWPEAWMNL